MIRIVVAIFGMAFLLLGDVLAQPSQAFDVAAIRPDLVGAGAGTGFDLNGTGRLTVTNATLKFLIQSAYGVQSDQISGGPGWLDSDRFDIDAKTEKPEKIAPDQLHTMLQNLLADRFGFKTHRETREMTVYALVPDKGAPRMKESTEEGSTMSTNSGPGKIEVRGRTSMNQLAAYIAFKLGRVVLDRTGLKGFYDLTLEWDPQQAGDAPGPSVFTALHEQLGLRLESQKGPVEVLAIDNAEKASEN